MESARDVNPSRPDAGRREKSKLKVIFSHFFVVPQKVLRERTSQNLLRHHKEV